MSSASNWMIYQPLIVGLGAVVLATIGNTLLEWYRQSLHDRREARTLRRAFAEELKTHRRMSEGAMSQAQREETLGSYMVPIDRFMPVYDSMISRIGVLKPNEAAAILKVYSHIILSPKSLLLFGKVHRDEFASFVEVPVKYSAILQTWNTDRVAVIDEALAALRC